MRLIGIIIIGMLVAPVLCDAGIVYSGTNTETYAGWDDYGSSSDYGTIHSRSQWTGSHGIYAMTVTAEATGVNHFWYVAYYLPDTGTTTVDGWRQKTLVLCTGVQRQRL